MIRGILNFKQSVITLGISLVISGHLFAQTQAETQKSKIETRRLTPEERVEVKPYDGEVELSDVLKKRTTSFLEKMTALQGANLELHRIVSEYKGETFERKATRFSFFYSPDVDPNNKDLNGELLRNLNNQTSKTATEQFKESSELYKKIKSGMTFDLNLSKSKSSASSQKPATNIRYGLIVQDIVPQKASDRASLDSFDELTYAKKARVRYTIGKVEEEAPSSIIPVPVNYETQDESYSFFTSSMDRFRAPKPDFAMRVEPGVDSGTSVGNLNGTMIFEQKEGLYRYRKIVGSNSMTPDQVERYPTHELRVPTYRAVAVGRTYNDGRKPVQSSVYGILVSESLPQVNLHYMEIDERYRAELILVKNTTTIKSNVEMRQGWKPGQAANQEGDRVTLELTRPL